MVHVKRLIAQSKTICVKSVALSNCRTISLEIARNFIPTMSQVCPNHHREFSQSSHSKNQSNSWAYLSGNEARLVKIGHPKNSGNPLGIRQIHADRFFKDVKNRRINWNVCISFTVGINTNKTTQPIAIPTFYSQPKNRSRFLYAIENMIDFFQINLRLGGRFNSWQHRRWRFRSAIGSMGTCYRCFAVISGSGPPGGGARRGEPPRTPVRLTRDDAPAILVTKSRKTAVNSFQITKVIYRDNFQKLARVKLSKMCRKTYSNVQYWRKVSTVIAASVFETSDLICIFLIYSCSFFKVYYV